MEYFTYKLKNLHWKSINWNNIFFFIWDKGERPYDVVSIRCPGSEYLANCTCPLLSLIVSGTDGLSVTTTVFFLLPNSGHLDPDVLITDHQISQRAETFLSHDTAFNQLEPSTYLFSLSLYTPLNAIIPSSDVTQESGAFNTFYPPLISLMYIF